MAFSPDGTKLRVAQYLNSRILEFDADGKATIFFEGYPEFVAPLAANCVAFDRQGAFYVSSFRRIFRFPPGSNIPEVFADDETDPLLQENSGPIVIDRTGDLYIVPRAGGGEPQRILRFQGPHNASLFESTASGAATMSLAADACGFLYTGEDRSSLTIPQRLFRYLSGDPTTKELLAAFPEFAVGIVIALDPSDSFVYVAIGVPPQVFKVPTSGGPLELVTTLASATGNPTGIAVVPVQNPSYGYTPCPPPIPTVSAWGIVVLTILLLIGGKLKGQCVRS
jgi:hypothetical protein